MTMVQATVKNKIYLSEKYSQEYSRHSTFVDNFFHAISAGQLLKESPIMIFQTFSCLPDKNHDTGYYIIRFICAFNHFIFYYKQMLTAVNDLRVF